MEVWDILIGTCHAFCVIFVDLVPEVVCVEGEEEHGGDGVLRILSLCEGEDPDALSGESHFKTAGEDCPLLIGEHDAPLIPRPRGSSLRIKGPGQLGGVGDRVVLVERGFPLPSPSGDIAVGVALEAPDFLSIPSAAGLPLAKSCSVCDL